MEYITASSLVFYMPQQIPKTLHKIAHIRSQLVVPFITKPTVEGWRDCRAKVVGGVACNDLKRSIVGSLKSAACSLSPPSMPGPHLWQWTTLVFTNSYGGVSQSSLKSPK